MSEARRRRRATRQAHAPVTRHVGELALPREALWISIALAASVAVVYWPVHGFGFVRFDDPAYVSENPHIANGLSWAGVGWALTSGYAANWHPLTWLSHMMDVQLFGLDAGMHHATNVILHAATTVLLFGVLFRTTGAAWRSAVVAGLFGLHPIHVESVAWVAERKDVLSAFFWVVTLWAYVAYVRRPGAIRYAGVAASFVLALMAKPMVVTLPFVLLLFDVWPLERTSVSLKQRVIEKLPLFALAGVVSVITVIAQRKGGTVGSIAAYPLALRLANAIVSYVAYVGMTIWPSHLGAFYPYRASPSALVVAGSALLLAGLTAAVFVGARRRPYLLVGWLWYVGTLTPVIGVVQAGLQSMADRYTYIPLVGLFIVVAWGLGDVASTLSVQRLAIPAAVAAMVACAVKARQQVETWHDSLSLWGNAVATTSNNAYAEYNLGVVLVESGRLDDGIARFRAALRIDPGYPDVHIDLGNALNERGAVDEAIAQFDTVVRLRPDYAQARVVFGKLLRTRDRDAEAIGQFREAIRLEPSLASAHNELGNALMGDGRYPDAQLEYAEAVRLDPRFPEAHNNLGAVLVRVGKPQDAVGEFLEAVRLKPDDPRFHYNAGLTLEAVGRKTEAIEQLQTVLRAEPSNEAARRALDRLGVGRSGV